MVAKTTGTFYGVSMTAGDLYTIAYVGLSGAPSTAIDMGDVAAVANGLSVDPNGNIVVGDGDGAYFVNVQTSGSLSLYGRTIQHQSAVVVAGSAQGGTDCSAGAPRSGELAVLPERGTLRRQLGQHLPRRQRDRRRERRRVRLGPPGTVGHLRRHERHRGQRLQLGRQRWHLGHPDGTAGIDANVSGTSEMTVDPAGNVVLAVESGSGYGTSPAIQILAKSSCASSCAYGLSSTTAGDIYTVAGGSSNVLATLSGPTSVLSDGTGNLYFTDGRPRVPISTS